MSDSLKLWQIPLSKLFFYALILLLPFNIQWVRFTETSFYYGYHAFYNTVFISLTDILICGLVIVWLWETLPLPAEYSVPSPLKERGILKGLYTGFKQLINSLLTIVSQKRLYSALAVFWLILAISTLVSRETFLSFYGLGKITLYFLVFLYVSQKHIRRESVFWLMVIGAAVQSVIGISQYLNQHSLGLQFLGESVLVPMMKGIAEFPSGETILIRAYGTFPHPNLLGAWLFTGFLANIWLLYNVSQKPGKVNSPPPLSSPLKVEGFPSLAVSAVASGGGWEGRGWGWVSISRETILAISLILITIGLTLTFSRTIWLVSMLSIVVVFVISRFHRNKVFARMQSAQRETGAQNYRPARIALIIGVLLVSLGLNWFLFGQQIKERIHPHLTSPLQGEEIKDESWKDRQLFNDLAWEMAKDHPIFGLGMRNIVTRMGEYSQGKLLPHLHQPVHNIYLLVLAEAGIVGLAGFLWVIYEILKSSWVNWGDGGDRGMQIILLIAFGGFLIFGSFDHYFFSLNQGGLMFWLVGGLLVANGAQSA